jgi:hypothetical protein
MLSAILIYDEKADRCRFSVQEFKRNAMKHRVGEQHTFQAGTGAECAAFLDAMVENLIAREFAPAPQPVHFPFRHMDPWISEPQQTPDPG